MMFFLHGRLEDAEIRHRRMPFVIGNNQDLVFVLLLGPSFPMLHGFCFLLLDFLCFPYARPTDLLPFACIPLFPQCLH